MSPPWKGEVRAVSLCTQLAWAAGARWGRIKIRLDNWQWFASHGMLRVYHLSSQHIFLDSFYFCHSSLSSHVTSSERLSLRTHSKIPPSLLCHSITSHRFFLFRVLLLIFKIILLIYLFSCLLSLSSLECKFHGDWVYLCFIHSCNPLPHIIPSI